MKGFGIPMTNQMSKSAAPESAVDMNPGGEKVRMKILYSEF